MVYTHKKIHELYIKVTMYNMVGYLVGAFTF